MFTSNTQCSCCFKAKNSDIYFPKGVNGDLVLLNSNNVSSQNQCNYSRLNKDNTNLVKQIAKYQSNDTFKLLDKNLIKGDILGVYDILSGVDHYDGATKYIVNAINYCYNDVMRKLAIINNCNLNSIIQPSVQNMNIIKGKIKNKDITKDNLIADLYVSLSCYLKNVVVDFVYSNRYLSAFVILEHIIKEYGCDTWAENYKTKIQNAFTKMLDTNNTQKYNIDDNEMVSVEKLQTLIARGVTTNEALKQYGITLEQSKNEY